MKCCLIQFAGFLGLLFFNAALLNAQFNTASGGRIESEFKLSVPVGQEAEIWDFLQQTFDDAGIKKLDTTYRAIVAQEIFYDQYFDNEIQQLFQHQAGVRFRQRYVGDSLTKELLQLKLPLNDSAGVARQEIKFNVYKRRKKTDRQAMHPFWRYVQPKNRDEVNLHLAGLGLTGDVLQPALKVRQDRKRIYVFEKETPLMTMTFDEVCSFYFPYPCFTELELELNEIRFTEGNVAERSRMEQINQSVKEEIMTRFPSLRQDQTPKYNKMHLLLKDNLLEKIYSNLMYIILGGIVAYALILFIWNHLRQKQKLLANASR